MKIKLGRVLNHYDLGNLKAARRVKRGFVNENWEIETAQGRYFLKHRHPALCNPDIIDAQHALMRHLREAGFPAPTIVPTATGESFLMLSHDIYEIQGFIAGRPYNHADLAHFREAARTLGRYHTCVHGFDAQPLRDRGELYTPSILETNLARLVAAWELEQAPALMRIVHLLKRHAVDLATRFAKHGPLTRLMIHGDYYADNLLFDEEESNHIVGVVDYDKARWQPRVVELAEALIYFASPRAGHLKHLVYPGVLQWEPFARFLHHYARVVTLGENETCILPDYVRCIWLSISLQRLWEGGPRPLKASEALQEVLALGDWAANNARRMVEIVRDSQISRDGYDQRDVPLLSMAIS